MVGQSSNEYRSCDVQVKRWLPNGNNENVSYRHAETGKEQGYAQVLLLTRAMMFVMYIPKTIEYRVAGGDKTKHALIFLQLLVMCWRYAYSSSYHIKSML